MTIVTSSYRPKRSPYPESMPTIVETKPPKKRLKGPVIRLGAEEAEQVDNISL